MAILKARRSALGDLETLRSYVERADGLSSSTLGYEEHMVQGSKLSLFGDDE